MIVGVPKEIKKDEYRIALAPPPPPPRPLRPPAIPF